MANSTSKLQLYTVDDSYVLDLNQNVSKHVFTNANDGYIHSRKYLGIVLRINQYEYYAPLSSPKAADYIIASNGVRRIRKSIVPIVRMTEDHGNGNKVLLGTIRLGNMIPVPQEYLSLYDIGAETDLSYKGLVLKEMRFIGRNEALIRNRAISLYNQKKNNISGIGYLNNVLDFDALERYVDSRYDNQ